MALALENAECCRIETPGKTPENDLQIEVHMQPFYRFWIAFKDNFCKFYLAFLKN